jgi:hypothetical protein
MYRHCVYVYHDKQLLSSTTDPVTGVADQVKHLEQVVKGDARPSQSAVDEGRPRVAEGRLGPAGSNRFGDDGAVVEGVEDAAHGQDGVGLVGGRVKPGRIVEHRRPPVVEQVDHGAAQAVRGDRVDQSVGWRPGHGYALLAQDVAKDDAVGVVVLDTQAAAHRQVRMHGGHPAGCRSLPAWQPSEG